MNNCPTPYLGVPGQVIEVRNQISEVVVLTGKGTLILEEVETDTRGRQRAADIIRSGRTSLGMDLEQEVGCLTERIAELQAQVQRG